MKRKTLAAVLLTAICTFFAIPQPTMAGGHEKVVGVNAGFNSRNTTGEGGVFFQFGVSRVVRLSMDAELDFRNKDRDAFMFDLNVHFPFRTSARCEFYPLVGATYASWAYHDVQPVDTDTEVTTDVTTRHGYFGINAGAGFSVMVTPTLKFKTEAMFTAVKSNNAARILLGIGYSF